MDSRTYLELDAEEQAQKYEQIRMDWS
jgi:hypothetical protein